MSNTEIAIPGYRIQSRLSAGGMATVYVADQLKLNSRQVAIKVFRSVNPDHTRDRKRRFEQEAMLARNLQHPHIVQIFDYGSTDAFQYLVMEYLAHGDLKQRIRAGIDAPASLTLLRQMASALQLLHDADIVHRDIKPANILFRTPDHAVLADFGIARAIDQSTQLTQTGFVLGTPSYMSPEQINGGAISARSDIYALGVVFYEMLTGMQPYRGDSVQGVATQHLMAPVPQLPLHVRKLQPLLNAMMAKKPAERIASGKALMQAIDALDLSRGFAVKPPNFVQRHAAKIAVITALFAGSAALAGFGISQLPRWLDREVPQDFSVREEVEKQIVQPVAPRADANNAVAAPVNAQPVSAPAAAPSAAVNPDAVAADTSPAEKSESTKKNIAPPAVTSSVKEQKPPRREREVASDPAPQKLPTPTAPRVKTKTDAAPAIARPAITQPSPAPAMPPPQPVVQPPPAAEVVATKVEAVDATAQPAPPPVQSAPPVEKNKDAEASEKKVVKKPPPVISYF